MTWFILALGASVFWACGQVLIKKGFENIPPLWNNIFSNFLLLFIYLIPALLLSNFRITIPSLPIFFIILVAASFYLTFYYAISKGEISLTGTVVAGYPVTTILLAYLFLGERLAAFQFVGVCFVIAGVVLVAMPEMDKAKESKDFSWFKWGLSASVLIGAGDFLTKLSINNIGSYSYIFFLAVISNPLSFFNYLIDMRSRAFPSIREKKVLFTFIGIIAVLTGSLLFFLSFDYGKVSLITPVSSIYPALTALLAVRFLHEKITLKQCIGIAVTVVGLILIGFSSV